MRPEEIEARKMRPEELEAKKMRPVKSEAKKMRPEKSEANKMRPKKIEAMSICEAQLHYNHYYFCLKIEKLRLKITNLIVSCFRYVD